MKNLLKTITGILTVIGAVNWGLVGLLDIDLVKMAFSTMPMVQKAIYIIIGASGLIFGAQEASEEVNVRS